MNDRRLIRVAALADLHFGRTSQQPLPDLAALTSEADVLLLCGDLTDHGLPAEAQGLAKQLSTVKAPIVAVLGNHDFESGHADEVSAILLEANVAMLDGSVCEVAGIGFAGTKGFCGGFDRQTLEPWGEPIVKAFVQEALSETLKLESALARLRTPRSIALLHYAPVQATVAGEPEALYPFLGCSRLEEPLIRFSVSAVFHGHAHRGTAEGQLRSGAPVFNVSLPLLRRERPDDPPVRVFEIETEAADAPSIRSDASAFRSSP
jgi:Icc-related predicted phosphoesterase